MAKLQELAVVKLMEDFLDEDVVRGTIGTILLVFDRSDRPEAYEIEVSALDGRSIAQFVALPTQLRLAR